MMKAITLYQPYASAIALGLKHFETRSWQTSYRGPLAIHASLSMSRKAKEFARTEVALGRIPRSLPLGCIVCIATLIDVLPAVEVGLQVDAIERMYGDYAPGRWAWKLDHVRVLVDLIFVRGKQGLWNCDVLKTLMLKKMPR